MRGERERWHGPARPGPESALAAAAGGGAVLGFLMWADALERVQESRTRVAPEAVLGAEVDQVPLGKELAFRSSASRSGALRDFMNS